MKKERKKEDMKMTEEHTKELKEKIDACIAFETYGEDLEQRVAEMFASDIKTGEHKDASPLDYVRWAIEEIEANHRK